MSTVLWIQLETDEEEFLPDDLGYLYRQVDELDQQCRALNVQPLGEFIDYSDMELNFSEEDLDEEWAEENKKMVNPGELLKTLRALENNVNESEEGAELLEEIRYIINRCAEAEKNNVQVRLVAVM
jgi:hypothetical protein